MNHEEAIQFINGRASFGKKLGLQNMQLLLARLDNPQLSFETIHVGGTNGKGSTCAFIDSALRQSGLRVGLYTSPYLMQFNERIRLNGRPISNEFLCRCVETVAAQVIQMEQSGEGIPTVFEVGTATAFLAFREYGVKVAVIEVGLGGTYDSTNVIRPLVCAIARIGLDHTSVLGNTLQEIATNKAGIAKAGTPLVLQRQIRDINAVVAEQCSARGAELHDLQNEPVKGLQLHENGARFCQEIPGLEGEVSISMAGENQVDNAMTALKVLSLLKEKYGLNKETVLEGMKNAFWPGRLEWLDGEILLDGAHNPQGMQSLVDYIGRWLPGRRITLLFGMMGNKAVAQCVELIAPVVSQVIAVRPENIPRAESAQSIQAMFAQLGVAATTAETSKEGLAKALESRQDGIILVCGSLYLVGELRLLLMKE